MRSIKAKALLKAGVLLTLFSLMGCPTNTGNDIQQNNAMSLYDIKGDGPANEQLKGTVWDSHVGNRIVASLEFANDSNTCVVSPGHGKEYVAEYEVKENKINLKLDKAIEFFKNYTVLNYLKNDQKDTEKYVAIMGEELKNPNLPSEEKQNLEKEIELYGKALKEGIFDSYEKYKKFVIEVMLPHMISQTEKQIKDPNIPEGAKTNLEKQLAEMKEKLKNPSLIDDEISNVVEQTKKKATHLAKINPIILTLPEGKTLETAQTMTANTMFLDTDGEKKPIYENNVEFTKKKS